MHSQTVTVPESAIALSGTIMWPKYCTVEKTKKGISPRALHFVGERNFEPTKFRPNAFAPLL